MLRKGGKDGAVMNYALDIIFLFIFLLFIAVGAHRGFVRSAAHFLGSVLAACLASVLGGAVAQWVFDALFRDALVEKIEESLAGLGTGNVAASVEGLFSSLPDFIVRALEDGGVTASSIAGGIASQSGRAAELAADSLEPVFVGFLKVLAVIVLFLLFMMLVRVLADIVGKAFRLPILSQFNGILGAVFGFLLALVSVWVAVSALQVFIPMLGSEARAGLEGALRQSLVAKLVVGWNPLGAMYG